MNPLFPIGSVWITPLAFQSLQTHLQHYQDLHQTGDFGNVGEKTRAENIANAEIIGHRKEGSPNTQRNIVSCFDSIVSGYEIVITTLYLNGVTETFVSRSDEDPVPTLALS